MNSVTPEQALIRMQEGNARFQAGLNDPKEFLAPHRDQETLGREAKAQHPFASILTCSDARVPPELIFDLGLGDLFVIRVAGNVCDSIVIGSIEFVICQLQTPLVIVMGHTNCGAVRAAVQGSQVPGSVASVVSHILPALEHTRAALPSVTGLDLVNPVVEQNVWHSIEDLLEESSETRKLIQQKTLLVVGAVYNLESGHVDWKGEHCEQDGLLSEVDN